MCLIFVTSWFGIALFLSQYQPIRFRRFQVSFSISRRPWSYLL